MADIEESEVCAWNTSWDRWADEVSVRIVDREVRRARRRFREGLTRRPCRPSLCCW